MHRRSLLGRLGAALAGLSFGDVPNLQCLGPPPADSLPGGSFSVTRETLAESAGLVTCPGCGEMWDSLELTPAGRCLLCADRDPAVKAEPYSDPFWVLSNEAVGKLEREIERLSAESKRMNNRLISVRQVAEGGDGFDLVVEAARGEWQRLQRELHLLHLLRAASRHFGSRPHLLDGPGVTQTPSR